MYHILKNGDAGSAPRPEGDWLEASIIWIEPKPDSTGALAKEVIYEVHADPDIFRQVVVTDEYLFSGAKRGDSVLVDARILQGETAHTKRKAP